MSLSICTQIKDRLEFLEQTLPTWLKYPADEIVIADWNSKEPVRDFVMSVGDPRIVYVHVDEDIPYNISRAKNLCVMSSVSDYVLYLDCDVGMQDIFPKDIRIAKKVFLQGWGDTDFNAHGQDIVKTYGCCMFHRSSFDAVGGYNERLEGYGYDDSDFYQRLIGRGFEHVQMPDGLRHIEHGDDLRVSCYLEKDLEYATLRNRLRSKSSGWGPSDTVEPVKYTVHRLNQKN